MLRKFTGKKIPSHYLAEWTSVLGGSGRSQASPLWLHCHSRHTCNGAATFSGPNPDGNLRSESPPSGVWVGCRTATVFAEPLRQSSTANPHADL
eukprot:2685-Amphidinium_carterae.1